MKNIDAKVAHAVHSTALFGNFLGWDVCRAPLITSNNSGFARIQSKKYMYCPIDAFLLISCVKLKDAIPTIITPIGLIFTSTTKSARNYSRVRRKYAGVLIADSEANRHIRSAEGEEDNVEWVTEGGMNTTLTEVNETSIDVEFDRWGTFHTNEHAEYTMSQWAQYATWWEQSVAPARLIQ
ncbi:hypothetical protein PHMEG_00010698 [Phytophthora megakarya]|uniref:Uncharacterized protein n=1 Tax=Phytophthora megakarya TaxID=4795 RepID=A0A225WD26_9STRA|nr:hypothetical protein PHMEG_00010698 [Phytophthora megakarya]